MLADDDRDFIERANSGSTKLHGELMNIDDLAENFALYGLQKRAAALESLDAGLREEIESGSHSLRRRVQLMTLRKRIGGVHEALRKPNDECGADQPGAGGAGAGANTGGADVCKVVRAEPRFLVSGRARGRRKSPS